MPVPPFRRILTSGLMSCLVIAGLALLAEGSTRAQLDRALRLPAIETALRGEPASEGEIVLERKAVSQGNVALEGKTALQVTGVERAAPSGRGLDRRRLEATVLMVSPDGEP